MSSTVCGNVQSYVLKAGFLISKEGKRWESAFPFSSFQHLFLGLEVLLACLPNENIIGTKMIVKH
jgi:hypothetical protein